MSRITIDYGIDLGTTNSEIALCKGTEVEVFKNNEGSEYTPSAVYLDQKGRLVVGRRAKERSDSDKDNTATEFKLQMGTDWEKVFARDGRKMRSEELSAEVLKQLRADVKQKNGEDVRAAVITVPAAFELGQCDATNKAAKLAGFDQAVLVMEPVAAALAYGFQSKSDKVFWLVYDFGGGSFDAALIQVRDGLIQVVNHAGDNHLGGKLIDWAIVEQLFIPALTKMYRLTEFNRHNTKWSAAMAKLKLAAEVGKIRVSGEASAEIFIDGDLCLDDRGEKVQFEYELTQGEVAKLAQPFIVRTINLCKKVLQEKHLGPGNIEKLMLVGGPTVSPYLRKQLQDSTDGLGIALEYSIDPLTVVARGAAIFAATQPLVGEKKELEVGQFAVEHACPSVGPDPEPLMSGKVSGAGSQVTDYSGYAIEFVNNSAQPPWRSGKIGLAPNGAFMTQLWAERGKANTFQFELTDPRGVLQQTVPDRHVYTVGVTITDPPLIHSVGISLVTNEAAWFLEKGVSLPARHRDVRRTAFPVRKGQEGDVIRIPVIEGENKRADRNRFVGSLVITAHNVKMDVPAGSEVDITIEIDQSRLVRAKAYVPILDEEFEEVLDLKKARPNPQKLRKEFEAEKKRLEEARTKAKDSGDSKSSEVFRRIDSERMVPELESLLQAAETDPDSADKCENRLLEFQIALDEIESSLEWPALVIEADKWIKYAQVEMRLDRNADDRSEVSALIQDVNTAKRHNDSDFLRQKLEELQSVVWRMWNRDPQTHVIRLDACRKKRSLMRDEAKADALFAQADRAVANNDTEVLRAAVRQLFELLPVEEQQGVDNDRRGTTF